jgi:hypothetical protein
VIVKVDHRNGNVRSRGNGLGVAEQFHEMASHISANYFGSTSGTDSRQNIVNDNEVSSYPEVLLNALLLEGGVAGLAFPVIVQTVFCVWHVYSNA